MGTYSLSVTGIWNLLFKRCRNNTCDRTRIDSNRLSDRIYRRNHPDDSGGQTERFPVKKDCFKDCKDYFKDLCGSIPWNADDRSGSVYLLAAQIFNIQMGMWQSAFLIVSINTGAYMAESVRGGIISVDPGQTEGAKAIGMTHVQTMTNVILPQAFRNILPQIGNNLIINIKDTSVLSIISIVDLFFVHKSVAGALYTYFESAVIVMCMYLIMTLAASKLLRLWEKKMDGSQNYELVDVMGIGTQLGEEVKRGE